MSAKKTRVVDAGDADVAYEELPDEDRCVATRKRDGYRCPKPRVLGMRVCPDHGAGTTRSKDKQLMHRLTLGMARLPIDSSLRDPVAAFEDEFLRTVSRIAWLDKATANLTAEEIVWGKLSEDVVRATEWPGVNLGYGARVNALVELQFRERQHLLAIEKIWLGARLDTKRLEIAQNQATQLEIVMTAILAKLGHDTADANVRTIIANELASLPGAAGRDAEIRQARERVAEEDTFASQMTDDEDEE